MSASEQPIRELLQNTLIALGVEEEALRAAIRAEAERLGSSTATRAEVERLCGVAQKRRHGLAAGGGE